MSTHVAELHSYPIKGCGSLSHESVSVTERGLAYDREWLLVDHRGSFISQRRYPELAVVQPAISDSELTATIPSFGSVSVALESSHSTGQAEQSVEFFNKAGTGRTQSAEANSFFSDYLGIQVSLLRTEQPRPVNEKYRRYGAAASLGFADGFPMLLTSKASLAKLNSNLEAPVGIDRFRANIVIDGDSLEPYAEDRWRTLTIGNLRAYIVRACARCAVPDVDQQTGQRDSDRSVTKALRATRHGIDRYSSTRGDFFGQNLVHVYQPASQLALGQLVTVSLRSSKPNIRLP
ncbi:MAG: MOSC N-terminal beta barrel domain-containing protein [Patescibacteria group bacterium]|nr:MOSC N-terminal beta barrel domain-containing protein [Patescibacteria group bacterium]